jgi:hypothetical protein
MAGTEHDDGSAAAGTHRGITLVSCGIFRFELEKILPEIEAELADSNQRDGCVEVSFLAPGLDASGEKLEAALTESLDGGAAGQKALLYGKMCHTEMARITEKSGAIYPEAANCVEMILGTERKRELDAVGNVYYLTMGGLKLWREIYQDSHGWNEAYARVNFGYFDKVVVLDTGIFEIDDEELFEFFEYTQIPVEVMPVSLDHFKSVVRDLCRRRMGIEP